MTGYLHDDLCKCMIISGLSIFFRMRNFSDKSCGGNRHTHFMFNKFFCRKSFRLWDNVEKCGRARQGTEGNRAHAHCMLDNKGYRHTLRPRNAYCVSTANMVAGTRLDVTLYVHCLYCIYFLPRGYIVRLNTHIWQACKQICLFFLAIICLYMVLPVSS